MKQLIKFQPTELPVCPSVIADTCSLIVSSDVRLAVNVLCAYFNKTFSRSVFNFSSSCMAAAALVI